MGATRVLRDAMAESWQIVPGVCQECPAPCREAGGVTGAGPCVASGSVARFGDASPDLLYSASVLLQAFPDARFVQLIRDGRDVAADMLADPASLTWFKPAMLSDETEFPNPFLGVSSGEHRERWKAMPTAGKCALRWRSAVRLAASLHQELPREQLLTLRYEDLVSSPAEAAGGLSDFLETRVPKIALLGGNMPRVGIWRTRLRGQDAELVAKVAREELTRLGYVPSPEACPRSPPAAGHQFATSNIAPGRMSPGRAFRLAGVLGSASRIVSQVPSRDQRRCRL